MPVHVRRTWKVIRLAAAAALVAGCALDEDPVAPGVPRAVPRYAVAGASDGVRWLHEFGTSGFDAASAVAAAGGSVYVAGNAAGPLVPGAKGCCAFVRKYDASGVELWTRQIGTPAGTSVAGVAADAGGVYVVGTTGGALPGQRSAGGSDAFIRRYDASGIELWTRQFGTPGDDQLYAVAEGAGGVYVLGGSVVLGDFRCCLSLREYSASGSELWARGASDGDLDNPVPTALAVAAGAVYVAGWNYSDLPGQPPGGPHAVLRKYSATGTELWTRDYATACEGPDGRRGGWVIGYGVAADAVGAYLVGEISDCGFGAFVRRYDASGTERWTRTFRAEDAWATAAAADNSGVYVTGWAYGALTDQLQIGRGFSTFVRKYGPGGDTLWTTQLGRTSDISWSSVAADAGRLYVAGRTERAFTGQASFGGSDAFVARVSAAGPGGETLDIRPAQVSLSSSSTVTVYLFSSINLDATKVDVAGTTLTVEDSRAARVAQRQGQFMTAVGDYDGDGRADRLFVFTVSDLEAAGLGLGPARLTLTGPLSDGTHFEVAALTPPTIVP